MDLRQGINLLLTRGIRLAESQDWRGPIGLADAVSARAAVGSLKSRFLPAFRKGTTAIFFQFLVPATWGIRVQAHSRPASSRSLFGGMQ
jgi:hypothetical protein